MKAWQIPEMRHNEMIAAKAKRTNLPAIIMILYIKTSSLIISYLVHIILIHIIEICWIFCHHAKYLLPAYSVGTTIQNKFVKDSCTRMISH